MANKQIKGLYADMDAGEGGFNPPAYLNNETSLFLMDIYSDFIIDITWQYILASASHFDYLVARNPVTQKLSFEDAYQSYEQLMAEFDHDLTKYPQIKQQCQKIFEARPPTTSGPVLKIVPKN